MAKDPVCGMEIKEDRAKATSEYKGQKYHFCAVSCKQKFDKEPEKYLKKGKK
jgi:YHS domain-containing protein